MWELEASGDLDYYCIYFSPLFCDVLKQVLVDATFSEMLCDRRNFTSTFHRQGRE